MVGPTGVLGEDEDGDAVEYWRCKIKVQQEGGEEQLIPCFGALCWLRPSPHLSRSRGTARRRHGSDTNPDNATAELPYFTVFFSRMPGEPRSASAHRWKLETPNSPPLHPPVPIPELWEHRAHRHLRRQIFPLPPQFPNHVQRLVVQHSIFAQHILDRRRPPLDSPPLDARSECAEPVVLARRNDRRPRVAANDVQVGQCGTRDDEGMALLLSSSEPLVRHRVELFLVVERRVPRLHCMLRVLEGREEERPVRRWGDVRFGDHALLGEEGAISRQSEWGFELSKSAAVRGASLIAPRRAKAAATSSCVRSSALTRLNWSATSDWVESYSQSMGRQYEWWMGLSSVMSPMR